MAAVEARVQRTGSDRSIRYAVFPCLLRRERYTSRAGVLRRCSTKPTHSTIRMRRKSDKKKINGLQRDGKKKKFSQQFAENRLYNRKVGLEDEWNRWHRFDEFRSTGLGCVGNNFLKLGDSGSHAPKRSFQEGGRGTTNFLKFFKLRVIAI